MPPSQRRPTRVEVQRFAAEERFSRYKREMRDLLLSAEGDAQRGDWTEAANKLNASLMTIGAMSGVCQELRLIYLLIEE